VAVAVAEQPSASRPERGSATAAESRA